MPLAVGSPVAGRTKSTGVGIAGHDHAVVGGGELEIAHPGLEPLRLALGHRQVGAGDLRRRPWPWPAWPVCESNSASAFAIVALAASRAAVLDFNWFVDSSRTWGSTTPLLDLVLQPLDLRVPAVDLGLILVQDRLGLVEARLGRLDVGLGHLHHLEGQLDPLLVELDGRLLGPEVLDQLGHEQRGQRVSLLHLVADVHVPLLDIGRSAWDRPTCARKLSMKLGWPTTRTMVRTRRVDHLHGRRLRRRSRSRSWPRGRSPAPPARPGARRRAGGSRRQRFETVGRRTRVHQGPPDKRGRVDRPPLKLPSQGIRDSRQGTMHQDRPVRGVRSATGRPVQHAAWPLPPWACRCRGGVVVTRAESPWSVGDVPIDLRVVVRAFGIVRVDRRRAGHLAADHDREDRRQHEQGGKRRHHQPADHRQARAGPASGSLAPVPAPSAPCPRSSRRRSSRSAAAARPRRRWPPRSRSPPPSSARS